MMSRETTAEYAVAPHHATTSSAASGSATRSSSDAIDDLAPRRARGRGQPVPGARLSRPLCRVHRAPCLRRALPYSPTRPACRPWLVALVLLPLALALVAGLVALLARPLAVAGARRPRARALPTLRRAGGARRRPLQAGRSKRRCASSRPHSACIIVRADARLAEQIAPPSRRPALAPALGGRRPAAAARPPARARQGRPAARPARRDAAGVSPAPQPPAARRPPHPARARAAAERARHARAPCAS